MSSTLGFVVAAGVGGAGVGGAAGVGVPAAATL
jgi:hypothetical protein